MTQPIIVNEDGSFSETIGEWTIWCSTLVFSLSVTISSPKQSGEIDANGVLCLEVSPSEDNRHTPYPSDRHIPREVVLRAYEIFDHIKTQRGVT